MGLLKNRAPFEFCQIPNALIVDNKLSMGARILYCYLRSKPDGWKIYNAEIAKSLAVNPDTITKYWKELLEHGWISRQKSRDEKGNFSGGYDYEIHYKPQPKESEKPLNCENLYSGETTAHINNKKTINTEKNNILSSPKKSVARKRNALQVFSNAVIEGFEPQVKTDSQKEVWFRRNCRNLKDILSYCNQDIELALFTINETCTWLDKNNLQGGYEAVCRNLPEMYSKALKCREIGTKWVFSEEIKKQIEELGETNEKASAS